VKRFLVAAGVVALVVTAAAGAKPLAVPTKKAGKLIVGFDVPAPGFWNGRATGTTIKNPSGFEYALSTPQRAKVVTFSTSYFDANQGVLIRKGLAHPKSIADLKKLQLCAQSTTTGLSYIQHKLRPAKKPLVYSPSSTAAFDAVESGKCDALILDVPIVVSQSKKKPGAYGGVVGQIVTHEGYGAVMDHGSKLKPDIDNAIKALKANGTINKLQKKWLPFTRVPILK
jgi:ABC-type amino acid transport substrate-binding protein